MKALSILAWWHCRLIVTILALNSATVALADDEEAESPFQSLFAEDPALKPIPIVPGDGYYQVGSALTSSPEHGYRWELWAIQADGKPIGRMAPSGMLSSRRLIHPETGDTIGILDCTSAPSAVSLVNRYGRRIDLDLSMVMPGELVARTPYPLYRVQIRSGRGEPLDVDSDPIGWIDELQGALLDHRNRVVARVEPVRLTELGARTGHHSLFFEGHSLTTELMTSPPSHDLLRRIQERAANISRSERGLPTRLLRVELAARWLHVGAALVKDRNATITLPPERIEAARRALAAASINDLNMLWKESTRQVLWNAIAAAHPLYHIYAEAVGLAELRDDPAVLEHTLRLLKAAWIKAGDKQITINRSGPVEDWMRNGLIESMRFQAVRTPEDALTLSADFRTGALSTLIRPRGIGEPPVVNAYPAMLLHAAKQVSAMDRGMHLASALQRGGYDVTLWSILVEKIIDDTTKTKVQEPLIVFNKAAGKSPVFAIGSDTVLSQLKGKKIAPGYYEFPDFSALQPLLTRSAQFQVPMAGVLESQSSLGAWSRGIQKALAMVRPDDPNFTSILLESAGTDSWVQFNVRASESLGTLAQSRFALLIRENKIALNIERVKDNKVVETLPVKNVDSRPADEILAKHEATLGRVFQLLPPKMEKGLESVTLRSEPILEPLPSAIIEDGKIKIDSSNRRVIGRSGSNRMMLAAPRFPEAFHEAMHRWANSRTEQYTIGDWKGTLVDLFNNISWSLNDTETGWNRRNEDFKIEDFWWDYGATNPREDFAVIGQFYGSLPTSTRARVREELQKGNYIPAAKYLFFKQIVFLDSDGRSIEFDVDEIEKPFTVAEFDKAVRARNKQSGLTEEQERLYELVKRIQKLNEMLREKKATGSIRPKIEPNALILQTDTKG